MSTWHTYFVASVRDNLVDTSLLLLLYATLSEVAKKVLLTYIRENKNIIATPRLQGLAMHIQYTYTYIHASVYQYVAIAILSMILLNLSQVLVCT